MKWYQHQSFSQNSRFIYCGWTGVPFVRLIFIQSKMTRLCTASTHNMVAVGEVTPCQQRKAFQVGRSLEASTWRLVDHSVWNSTVNTSFDLSGGCHCESSRVGLHKVPYWDSYSRVTTADLTPPEDRGQSKLVNPHVLLKLCPHGTLATITSVWIAKKSQKTQPLLLTQALKFKPNTFVSFTVMSMMLGWKV